MSRDYLKRDRFDALPITERAYIEIASYLMEAANSNGFRNRRKRKALIQRALYIAEVFNLGPCEYFKLTK